LSKFPHVLIYTDIKRSLILPKYLFCLKIVEINSLLRMKENKN
jgi:hypothetical protein